MQHGSDTASRSLRGTRTAETIQSRKERREKMVHSSRRQTDLDQDLRRLCYGVELEVSTKAIVTTNIAAEANLAYEKNRRTTLLVNAVSKNSGNVLLVAGYQGHLVNLIVSKRQCPGIKLPPIIFKYIVDSE
jgi:hypothetical protein